MKPAARTKVLLVDDSRVVRKRLAGLLAELPGVNVVAEAERVAEAIRKIQRFKPQVVVLDISLPDGTGLEVLRAVRKPRRLFPRIIMLTNLAEEAYRDKCLELGAEYFFDKSAQFEQAVQVVKEMSRAPDRTAKKNAPQTRGRKMNSRMTPATPLLSDLRVLGAFAVYSFLSSDGAAAVMTASNMLVRSTHG